ncbi:hypothetical protein [Gordonia sp. NB41Y]|uniref:hypothetical protein n=1 Tax=Gordonia sp. NB41Y TaxID=875808 RepID=UPI00034DCA68|nr:hypothetical protein [Gordonia sp. NB41Y]WLP90609.1 hypothetical protein Q9K23_24500 [Gordonia sp. NB41Y]
MHGVTVFTDEVISSRLKMLISVAATALLGATVGATVLSAPASASPAPVSPTPTASPGLGAPTGACVIDPDNTEVTVQSLRHGCSSEQIMDLYLQASAGQAPTGTKTIVLLPVFEVRGKPISYGTAKALTTTQNLLGDSLTFTAGPNNTPWVYKDYIWGRDAGGELVFGDSRIDGRPAWSADFSRDFGGRPISLHEYRKLTDDLWIGRDIGGGQSTNGHTGGAFALY